MLLLRAVSREHSLRDLLLWTTLLYALGLTTQLLTHATQALGLQDQLFAHGDSAVLAALSQLTFLPVLVLAAQLCPLGVEARYSPGSC